LENTIKTLIVKQDLDPTGPRQSFAWQPEIDLAVLNEFKGKTSSWETFAYFKADLLIIPTKTSSPWLNSLISNPEYVNSLSSTTSDVINPLDFNFGNYDFVLTHDPILSPYLPELKLRYPKVLFGYLLAEHTSWQLHFQADEYDLFLDHTENSVDEVIRLPQSINFIYPRIPKRLSQLIPVSKTSIFFDYRSVGKLLKGGDNVGITIEEFNKFKNNINLDLDIENLSELSLTPFMFTSNAQSDAIEYYTKLRRSKYFITVANRIGQAAFDAASSGAVVIGNKSSKLHNIICHKSCLMEGDFNLNDIINKIKYLESNPKIFSDIISHQQQVLQKTCVDQPYKLIQKAIKIKQNGLLTKRS